MLYNFKYYCSKEKKIKIVSCCGFDSIPSDLGVFMITNEIKKRNLVPLEVRMLVGKTAGGVSGGTINSVINLIENSSMKEIQQFANPYYLCRTASSESPLQTNNKLVAANSDIYAPRYDQVYKKSVAPFIMQSINTRIVHRSNYLKDYSYGENFIYTEGMIVRNFIISSFISFAMAFGSFLLFIPFTRAILKKILPQPGQGPKVLEKGCFYLKYWGKGKNIGSNKEEIIYGACDAPNGDPGYIQTSKMLSECGLCLLTNEKEKNQNESQQQEYGVITPSIAFGTQLIDRLRNKGIDFYITPSTTTKG